jgi:hypothetical protein
VRLSITAGINDSAGGGDAARVDEFEVYGTGGSTSPNLALNRPATGTAPCGPAEGPEKAVNGSVSGGNSDKWCSGDTATPTLQVDLGSSKSITSFVVRHAGAGGENASYNTKDFDLDVSPDGVTWSTAAQVRGNTASVSTHPVNVTGRYIRIRVIAGQQSGSNAARIYELEAYA